MLLVSHPTKDSHLIVVHPEKLQVDAGNSFDETLVAGGQLELTEEAGTNAAGGGTAETNLFKNIAKLMLITC